jgi:hypothetical protein
MNWKRSALAAGPLSVALAGTAAAQVIIAYFTGFLAAVPAPSPFPADWQRSGTLATMTTLNSYGNVTCTIQGVLVSGQGSGATIPRSTVIPGGANALATPLLADWATLSLSGKARESVDKTGHLPDGNYIVTILVTNAHDASGQPLQDFTASTSFVVSVPQPPSLLFPPNGAVVSVPNPIFQWTPTLRASGTQPAYRFRMVEMLPGQTALRAIEADYPVLEQSIEGATALLYPASAPQLVDGRTYAWRVQSIESGQTLGANQQNLIVPAGANEGLSQVYTFVWRPRIQAGDSPGLGAPRGDSSEPMHGERAPAPGFEGRRNFADRLLGAMVARWSAVSQASHAERVGAMPISRAEWSRALSGLFLAAAYDSTVGGSETQPAPDVAPATPEEAPATPGEGGFGPQWLKLHGNATLAGETYSRDGSGAPTRPFHSARLTTGLSFGLMNDRLRMPLNALVSGDQVAFRQNINQVALSPHFSWAGLLAGNFTPQYSTYTLADATLLGGGIDLTPRKWRIGFANGLSRKAIAADPTALVQPQFARTMTAGRIGYGDPQANTVEISVMRAKDDASSLSDPDTTLVTTPESNTVYGFRTQRVAPRRHLRAELEGAWSSYDRDHRADAPAVKGRAIGLKLFRETVFSSLSANFQVLNGGFVSLGNSAISNDRVEFGLTGRTQLMGGKLSLNGNAGWRNDNVSQTLLAETARRDYSVNASWMPEPHFGADLQFGFMTSDVSEADSVAGSSNITRVLAISPHVNWAMRGIQQTLSGSATIQSSDNATTAPVPLSNAKGLTLLANWLAALSPVLSVNFAGSYTKSDLDVAVSEISSFGPGFSWNLIRARVAAGAQLQFTRSRTGNVGTDTEFAPRCELTWQTTPHHAFVLRGNFRRYRYAAGVPEFDERAATLEYVTTL